MTKPQEILQFDLILNEIAHFATFSLGKEAILNLQPSHSKLWIERENARTQTAMECERLYGPLPMPGMTNINDALIKASKDQILDFEELINVARFTHAVLQTQSYFKSAEINLSALSDLIQSLEVNLDLAKKIERCFSPSLEMLDSASKELASIRTKFRKKNSERADKIQRFISSNAAKLTDTISTTRNDRIVVLAKNSDKNSFGGIIHGESASGLSAYVEPPLFIQLNNEISELFALEKAEIEKICFELSQAIKPYAVMYESSLDTMAILDSHFARAIYGNKKGGICALINEDKILYLKDIRHPLIDPKTVISNTYRLDKEHLMILITGPNTGGKTVSLKVMGLACLMAYSGIPLLCDRADVPLFDQLFVDIGDDQSIQQSLSTFSSHLTKLIDVTQHATKDSFVLLDELGGGTDPVEGESLAIAILETLRDRGVSTVATTHYTRLKQYAMQHENVLIASVQFDMEEMKPNYKYVEQLPGQSFAFEIAERFGLSPSILEKAIEIRESFKTVAEKQLETIERQMAELYQREESLKQLENEINLEKEQVSKAKDVFVTYKDELYLKAQSELKDFIEEKEEEALKILDDLKKEHISSRKEVVEKLQSIPDTPNFNTLDKVKVGQWVKHKLSHQIGQIVEAKKRIFMQVNGIRMEVKLEDLEAANEPIKPKKFVVKSAPVESVPHELNCIGLRVDEALPLIDAYLDDCVLAKYPFCRLIHGHGTGALRSAVHSYLDKASFVESYRLGQQGEGGPGATVVYFKGHK